MKIFLSNQKHKLHHHLEAFKARKVIHYDPAILIEKVTSIPVNTSASLNDLDLTFFFNYKIFPPHIMSFLTQWEAEHRQMQTGDTIVQQAYLPPHQTLSQKIVFAVRISEVIDTPYRKGFSYETVEGHVEKGISTFTLEQDDTGIVFKIHTFSTPGNILTRLLGPVFSVPYQTYCTKQALLYVKQQLL
jgi:hypothetical protein